MGKQLNIYVDKPTFYEIDVDEVYADEYWFLDLYGTIITRNWYNDEIDDSLYFNTILFKDFESTRNYREFMCDVRRLQKAFKDGGRNYYFVFDYRLKINEVYIRCADDVQRRDYYFTKENAMWLLEKYGSDFIKNWILYCR